MIIFADGTLACEPLVNGCAYFTRDTIKGVWRQCSPHSWAEFYSYWFHAA